MQPRVTRTKVYIAAGWFTPEQDAIVSLIEKICRDCDIDMFSPRLEVIYKPGMDHKEIVAANVNAMDECDFIIASTEGKDMGTLFECGYAYAEKIPTVYYYPHDGKFNIMLAATARAVLTSEAQLIGYMDTVVSKGLTVDIPHIGEME